MDEPQPFAPPTAQLTHQSSASREKSNEATPCAASTAPTFDIADIGVGDNDVIGKTEPPARTGEVSRLTGPVTSIMVPARPQIQRDQLQPPPPPPQQQPPPPPAPPQGDQATDSLSLMQLRRLVIDMPRMEPTAYAFVYSDAASYPKEVEEWFSYSAGEQAVLLPENRSRFTERWHNYLGEEQSASGQHSSWIKANEIKRHKFLAREVAGLENPDIEQRTACLASLVYIALGVWEESAGAIGTSQDEAQEPSGHSADAHYAASSLQIQWMVKGAEMVYEAMGIQGAFDVLRGACLREWDGSAMRDVAPDERQPLIGLENRELLNASTLMYLLVEAARYQADANGDTRLKDEIGALDPDYLLFFVKLLARLRWDESPELPLTKVLLLFWKSVLLLFGGTKQLEETKAATRAEENGASAVSDKILKFASPLDYHLFRKEITSKYPAYNPPAPLIPLGLDTNSILPPLANHPSRSSSSGIGQANVHSNGGSIMHQPVHIATPAPSPPPSPIGPGGKAGKKQNYQTNQNFPFLYPPLDSSSSFAGGKAGLGFRLTSSGKKWEGSDIPTSILEAGELFAGRMKVSRALKQLWEERERFMIFERGWDGPEVSKGQATDSGGEKDKMPRGLWEAPTATSDPAHLQVKQRLETVEHFYRHALPHLQSLVIVLLKVVLTNVTALITQPSANNGQAPLAPAFQPQENLGQSRVRASDAAARAVNGYINGVNHTGDLSPVDTVDENHSTRTREITSKAVSGVILLLLKWFKISHVLKYEYLTQLLLDSNYLPLILKLFAHQDMDKVVDSKTDREDLSFFALCRQLSRGYPSMAGADENSEDEACPPPIVKRQRDEERSFAGEINNEADPNSSRNRAPEVDELGHPLSEPPSEPITAFSWRNFFSSINYLRIMQKICKNKAHRNLLLVQYKSSTILKKCLKVPQPELRLYTLKLFKNQVPYCGRKWRQTNMRVITAVYLHCRPELRDDWLAGSDVDAEVEAALPLEQALRALTHWHNLMRYPEQMGAEKGMLEEEQDFFLRELERMDFGDDGSAGDEGPGDGVWEGPLHMEGW